MANGNDTVSPIIKTVEKAFIADESQLVEKKHALPKNPFIRRIHEPKQSYHMSLQDARDVAKNQKKDTPAIELQKVFKEADSEENGKHTFE